MTDVFKMIRISAFVVCSLAALQLSVSFSAPSENRAHTVGRSFEQQTQLQAEAAKIEIEFEGGKRKRKCGPCPEPSSDDLDMDRREAAFAMLGWAASSALLFPQQAQATYGADANIALPNVVQGMSDRVNKQCIVESLGNRECLLYEDPENKLYKGADNRVLLDRLETSSMALATIPELVQNKQWSKVVSVLTGPMGTLVATMNQLSKLSENAAQASELAKKVKTDLYAISANVERKQVDQALANHKIATDDLVAFAKSL